MQINNYADLVAFVRDNEVFMSLGRFTADSDPVTHEQEIFAARAIVDFLLADTQLRGIASEHYAEEDVTMLHEWVFFDVA